MTYNPFTYDLNNGFVELEVSKNVTKLSFTGSIKDFYNYNEYPHELIFEELARNLADTIIKKNLININIDKDELNAAINYHGTMYVSEKPLSFVHVKEDAFIVHGQRFYEQEIIEAIKNTYPEKLI